VAGEKGVAKLHDDRVTTPADFQRALKKQVTELQKGDVVLIHTGLMTVWPDPKEFVPNHPGINVESAAWLIDHGAVILGAGNMAVEQVPLDKESVHSYVFADRRVYLMEMAWLEHLAKDKDFEFAFISAPIKLRGATGSPIRPLALPLRVTTSAP